MKTIQIWSIIIAVFVGFSSLPAHATTIKPSIIFVHGAWADGSSWAEQTEALQAKDYKVLSVKIPQTSLVLTTRLYWLGIPGAAS